MKSFKNWIEEKHPEIDESFLQGAKNAFNKMANSKVAQNAISGVKGIVSRNSNVAQNAKKLAASGANGIVSGAKKAGELFRGAEKLIAQPGDNINDMVDMAAKKSAGGRTVVLVFNNREYVFKNGQHTG